MHDGVRKATQSPPPGRPSWVGRDDLPLVYLGWGQRDFHSDPLPLHFDQGTHYFVLLRGTIRVTTGDSTHAIQAPVALLVDPDCAFGITQSDPGTAEILVWVWRGSAALPELRPESGGFVKLALRHGPLDSLADLHSRCRNEVSLADACLPRSLVALRELVEIEILRASRPSPATRDVRWNLARAWMMNNLALRAPVPALCDYLRMTPSTLHRFFVNQSGSAPGCYFRQLKMREARRLIHEEGWQVKAAAYHLGYRHPNDLSRALAACRTTTDKPLEHP